MSHYAFETDDIVSCYQNHVAAFKIFPQRNFFLSVGGLKGAWIVALPCPHYNG